MATANPGPEPARASPAKRTMIDRLRRRLQNRPDSEHEMTPNRLVFASTVSLYLLIAGWNGSTQAAEFLRATGWSYVLYFVVSLGIFAHIVWRPEVSVARRLFAMVSDITMMSYAAAEYGMVSGFLYPFYLWTVFGNGFRFGTRYLYAAMLVANVGFLAVLTVTGMWGEHLGLSIALAACLVMLPMYAAKLIQKLNEAKQQAEQANRAKSAFLASISHELRTPLNAIIGLGDLLCDQIRDAEQARMVLTISNAGRSLLNLINSILDFSRIEAGRMPITVVENNLYAALRRIEAMLEVQAHTKALTFAVHITARVPARIRADFGHLEQVLVNLAANAIKFTERGFVVVSVDAVRSEAGRARLRFEVTDTGIGIAPEAQERIFESFTQADSSIIDRYGGTGLGLAISKQLVKLLDGEMGLISAPGKGSTFWFEIWVTALSADDTATSARNVPIVLLSRDQNLASVVAEAGDYLDVAEDVETAQIALGRAGEDELRAPILIVDDRAVDTASGLEWLRVMQEHARGLVLVTDTPGLDGIAPAIRTVCASSIARPVLRQSLEQAFRVVMTEGDRSGGETLLGRTVGSFRPLSILVAEDNGTNQMVIRKILERVGHTVSIADNGEAALDAMREREFDVVLMDVNMPVMNGIEATKLYRFASIGRHRVPIVALTADATPEAWERCKEAGMDACATKPIEPARLIEVIDSVTPRAASTEKTVEEQLELVANAAPFLATGASVDMETLENLENLGGEAFVGELVAQFSRDAGQLLRNLHNAVAEEDVHHFRELAHALRSAAANVGAARVFELCLALRAVTARELALDGETRMRELGEEMTRALGILEAHTARREAGAVPPARNAG